MRFDNKCEKCLHDEVCGKKEELIDKECSYALYEIVNTTNNLVFEEIYYKDSKISNYSNYMEKKHNLLADDLITYFNIQKDDKIVDFGAATGNLCFEFVEKGFENISGTDISYYAVEYGKKEFNLGEKLQYYNLELLSQPKDFVLILDVLEHIPNMEELDKVIELSKRDLGKYIIVRIPVAKNEGENFFLEVSKNDKTHVQCHCKERWINLFSKHGLELEEELSLNSIYSSDGVLSASFKTKNNSSFKIK